MFAAGDLEIASRGDAQVRAAKGGGQVFAGAAWALSAWRAARRLRGESAHVARSLHIHMSNSPCSPPLRVTSASWIQACFIGPGCEFGAGAAPSLLFPHKVRERSAGRRYVLVWHLVR